MLTFFLRNWGFTSAVLLMLSITGYFAWFERSKASVKEVAVITCLAMTAAAGRIPFAMIPSVQPTTVLVMLAGYTFGPQSGFLTGAMVALVSNFYLGQGPWTPWQMLAWGGAGISSGIFRRTFPHMGKAGFVGLSFFWGYAFGLTMTVWHWSAFVFPLTLKSFLLTYAGGVWFDTAHALGNALFAYCLAPPAIIILERFRKRLEFTHVDLSSKTIGRG